MTALHAPSGRFDRSLLGFSDGIGLLDLGRGAPLVVDPTRSRSAESLRDGRVL
jgi:hypothetical protein